MDKPGPKAYLPPSKIKELAKNPSKKPISLTEDDFPEFIPIIKSEEKPKFSYATLLKPKEELKEPEVIIPPSKSRVCVKDMPDPPGNNSPIDPTMFPDLTRYYQLRNQRLKEEATRRKRRIFDSSSEDETKQPEEEDSDFYDDIEDEEEGDLDEYDPSEFDRHR